MALTNHKQEEASSPQTSWHLAFAQALTWDLSPVQISVLTEVQLIPRVDILLLRKNQSTWTDKQLERLPDGIRQSQASHILLEFKYSQSLDNKAMAQAIGYDHFYKESQQLKDNEVQTFLVSAKKPQKDTRQPFGYQTQRYPGVYQSHRNLEQRIQLISLNELADEPYNAVFKLFATHQIEKAKALNALEKSRAVLEMPIELKSLFYGLLLFEGESDMEIEITPEQVQKAGQLLGKSYLSYLSPEERLAGIKPSEVMGYFKPADLLAGINPREVMGYFKPADLVAGINPHDLMNHFRQVNTLEELSTAEIEEFEHYLSELKKHKK